jgi:hypothetical protein
VTTATDNENRFTAPAEELVRHAVRELPFGDRITVTKMSSAAGNADVAVFNFPQLVNTLFGTRWDRLDSIGSRATLTWVDMQTLHRWLRDVIGDAEFADAVQAAVADAGHYKAQLDAITPLFRERVAQYRAVLDADGAEGD